MRDTTTYRNWAEQREKEARERAMDRKRINLTKSMGPSPEAVRKHHYRKPAPVTLAKIKLPPISDE